MFHFYSIVSSKHRYKTQNPALCFVHHPTIGVQNASSSVDAPYLCLNGDDGHTVSNENMRTHSCMPPSLGTRRFWKAVPTLQNEGSTHLRGAKTREYLTP